MSGGGNGGTGAPRDRHAYQYVVLRCVPRADREEFVNVGVVLYCQATGYLALAAHLDEPRLAALDPGLDTARVRASLAFAEAVCTGDAAAGGAAATGSTGNRFGFLRAPKSTVVQPGPVHGGLTDDPAADLERLTRAMVHPPPA